MSERAAFIQGLFHYDGEGLGHPAQFATPAVYLVPFDKRAQTIYFRAGNAAATMIYLVLTRAGVPMRYFPVGAQGAIHVPLAVLEDIPPGSLMEVLVAAEMSLKGSIVLDVGFMEIS